MHDPVADAAGSASTSTASTLGRGIELPRAHAIVAAVAHREFTAPAGRRLCRQARARRLFVDVKCQADAASAARSAASTVWQPVMRMRRRRTGRAMHAACAAPARAADALAGDRQRRVHRLAPGGGAARASASSVVGLDNFVDRPSPQPRRGARGASARTRGAGIAFIEADIRRPGSLPRAPARASTSCCTRRRSARCRARSSDPLRTQRANATGFLNMLVAARDAGVERFVYAASSSTYGDHPGAAEGRGRDRPAAVALRRHQVRQRALRRRVRRAATASQTIGLRYFNVFGPRQDPDGAYAAVIPRWVAAMLARRDRSRSTATARRRATSATSTTSCRRTCSRRPTSDAAAIGQVYNVAVGERTSLNELHAALARC